MELKTFSCYDNLVPCDTMGSPVQPADGSGSGVLHGAIPHLHLLTQVGQKSLKGQCSENFFKTEIGGVQTRSY